MEMTLVYCALPDFSISWYLIWIMYKSSIMERKTLLVAWPSGLRRWFKAPVISMAWVRIPPLPCFFYIFFTRYCSVNAPGIANWPCYFSLWGVLIASFNICNAWAQWISICKVQNVNLLVSTVQTAAVSVLYFCAAHPWLWQQLDTHRRTLDACTAMQLSECRQQWLWWF